MKKNILTIAALIAFAGMHAQIQTNNGTVNGITNSNVLLDGSSGFSTEAGAGPYVGKGIIIPSVDLVNFQFDLSQADGFTFPTYFDGMIVYNNATGNTLTTGNRPSTSLAVTPGYYYFSNPNGASNGNVTGGQWKALGGTASAGDNLGDHSATKTLAMNDNAIRLRTSTDPNHGIVYTPSLGGPRLWGDTGGALGTVNGTNALKWDSNGNVLSVGTITASKGNGYAQLIPSSTNANSGRLDIYKSGGIRIGYIGDNTSNMFYASEVGIHSFNNGITAAGNIVADKGAGNAQLIATNSTSNSGRLDIYKSGGVRMGYIGDNTSNMFYASEVGIHSFNNGITAAGNIVADKGAGNAQLIATNSTSNSGRLDIYKSGGIRMGYIGDNTSNMFYASEVGQHLFNNGITAAGNIIADKGSGTVQLIASSSAGSSGRLDIYKSGGTRMGYIGDNISNMFYVAEVGLHSFNKGIQADGNIEATGNVKASTGGGYAQLTSGNGSVSGRVDIYKPGGSRMGYIGNDTSNMFYAAEIGIHSFNTTIQTPRVQGPSDRRFKKDITPIYNATEKLNQLNGYTYTWKDKKEFPGQTLGEGKDMGVIAQEVEKVFPDAVMTNKDGYKSVNYNALIPVLIEALKESNKKIQALEDRLNGASAPAETSARLKQRADGLSISAAPVNVN